MKGIVRLSKIELKLVQVQVYFRHGARTPLHFVKSPLANVKWTPDCTKDAPETVIPIKHVDIFEGTPVDESTYDLMYRPVKLPGGEAIGMLTTTGQKDLFNFGNRLRKEYSGDGGILSDPPRISEMQLRSTRVGRTIKSLRSVVAGLTGRCVDGPLVIPSMDFNCDILFPNPKPCIFDDGTEELLSDFEICELKEKIKEALKVDRLVDEFESAGGKSSRDCQVYYVRDDYVARKHNGFPIPEALAALESQLDHCASVELLNELLGKRENWKSNLDVNIGPVVHLILSKMHQYASLPPLHLVAVHDSTILPMLLALDCCNETWPPFGADIIFELYHQTMGPSTQHSLFNGGLHHSEDSVHAQIDWSSIRVSQLWVRVRYLGVALPLASIWCSADDPVRCLTDSDEFVPLKEFLRRMTPLALSIDDYHAKCNVLMKMMKDANCPS